MANTPKGLVDVDVGRTAAQVISGRETCMKCGTCGCDSWHIIGEVRREDFDDPSQVTSTAMRVNCTHCGRWAYMTDVMKSQTPRWIHKTYVNGHKLTN